MLSNTIELVNITFTAVACESPMSYRPYRATMDDQILNEVAELTAGGSNIGVNAFSSISGRILTPASQSAGGLLMPYGWDQLRFSVLMEFEVTTPFGVERQIITGYTGYDEITATGNLDPSMPIFINSHTIAAPRYLQDQAGIRRTTYASTGSKQVLNAVQYTDPHDQSVKLASTPMRPSDALMHKQREELCLNTGNVKDTRSSLGDGYTSSNRDNVIGSRYLSKICRGYKSSIANNAEYSDMSGVLYGDAANAAGVAESNVNKSILFRKLKQDTDYGSVYSVTVAELAACWPQIYNDDIKTIFHRPPTAAISNVGSNEVWSGAVKETTLAYTLCQSVPALMNSLLFSDFSFEMNNRTIDGSINITIMGEPKFIIPVSDAFNRIQMMEATIASDIAGQILSSGVTDFSVIMTCCALGSNSVNLSINGGHPVPYSAPAYCDSIYTPVMGDGDGSLAALGDDMGHMLTNIFGSPADRSIQHSNESWDSAHGSIQDDYDCLYPEIYTGGL